MPFRWGASEAAAQVLVDRVKVGRQARSKHADWRGLLTRSVQDGRTLLRQVLAGAVRFTPEGDQFRFEGLAAMEKLLAGSVATEMASPPGTAPHWKTVTEISGRLSPDRRPVQQRVWCFGSQ